MRTWAWVAAVLVSTTALLGCIGNEDAGDAIDDQNLDVPIVSGTNRLVEAGTDADVPQFRVVGLGASAPEPTLGVTPEGSIFVVAGTKVFRSQDGGATFEDVGPKLGPLDNPPETLDPMLHVDPVTGRVFFDTLYVGCSYLSYSDDDGESWITNPAACGLPVDDHQTITTGATSLPSTYEGRAFYYCANQFADATCSVSLNGGLTFTVAVPVFARDHGAACGGITGHLDTAPDGSVYLPSWRCDEPWVAASHDGGLTWSAVRVAEQSSSGNDPQLSVDTAGNVYYFWVDLDGVPWFTTSIDGGATWAEPIDVSFDGLKSAVLTPIIAGDPGRVALAFLGATEGDPAEAGEVDEETPWDLYVSISENALDAAPTFTTVRVSDPSDPVFEGPCNGGYRCGGIVDFMDIEIGPDGRVYVASANDDGSSSEGFVATMVEGPLLLGAAS